MSTRSGEFVTLKKLIDEVGVDAVRYFFLERRSDQTLEFDIELAKKKNKDKVIDKIRNSKDVFYWSEGSLAFGKVRETDTSSEKKIYTDGITIGADKFTDDQGIKGLAFRFSENYIKVGNVGSKLDTDTYNLTYYSTTPHQRT